MADTFTGVKILQWIVQTYDIGPLWTAQPTYLISQAVYMLAGVVTLIHAFHKGGRWPYFWLATIIHGIYTDSFWHFVMPEFDNFWHSITPVVLFDARLPLHIIFVYPAFLYHAAYAVSKLNLPRYSEPFAVGLITVLIDIPYDIVAVKFVHWTWHDTDPNIYDRHYWVPWNSYYFHATFAASLYFFFHFIRDCLASKVAQWDSAGVKKEWISLLISAFLGMPGGVLLFVPIYHPLHDVLGIHTEVTFFLLFAVFGFFIIQGLLASRNQTNQSDSSVRTHKLDTIDCMMIFQLALHYAIYWIFVVFFDPETHRSHGPHEPIGPCNEIATLVTPMMQTLEKRKYFCPEDYDEKYFDFKCVGGQVPRNDATVYTICGTPFENRAEYITVLSTILIVAAAVFHGIYFRTQSQQINSQMKKQSIKKKN